MTTICQNNFAELTISKPVADDASFMTKLRNGFATPQGKLVTALFMVLAAMVCSQGAFAWTTPATGSFGYNIYDIAINKIANGPVGFVGGGWLIAMAATKMNEGWVRALPYAIGGSCLIKVEELTQSLGALIH
ncbi:conjugative transfer protein TraE [Cronobacter turicensis]|nr:conjugative transfer protein TraE [Cronobacter turicensis]